MQKCNAVRTLRVWSAHSMETKYITNSTNKGLHLLYNWGGRGKPQRFHWVLNNHVCLATEYLTSSLTTPLRIQILNLFLCAKVTNYSPMIPPTNQSQFLSFAIPKSLESIITSMKYLQTRNCLSKLQRRFVWSVQVLKKIDREAYKLKLPQCLVHSSSISTVRCLKHPGKESKWSYPVDAPLYQMLKW